MPEATLFRPDDAPEGQPVNFGPWAPHILGHLQRIESTCAEQLRRTSILETKFDAFAEKLEALEERVVKLEQAQIDARITDAQRTGIVTGIRWLWGAVIAGGTAIAGMVTYIIAHLPSGGAPR